MNSYFLEIDHHQLNKEGYLSCGDSFYSIKNDDGIICVLADGLGSGVKASVLSTLTTTMAAGFMNAKKDIKQAAEIILETLPVCSYRQIGYSTFTIIEASYSGDIRIIEHDNPPFALIRNGKCVKVDKQEIPIKTFRKSELFYSELSLKPEDRVVFYSDGVTQSGMGLPHLPLGWRESGVEKFLEKMLKDNPYLSAGEIAQRVTSKAREYDNNSPADDISCAAIYLRNPRRTLLVTGPPYKKEHDPVMAEIISTFKGRKLVCGGTTASIVSRELGKPINVNLKEVSHNSDVPPSATIEGIDLVCEGTITLSRTLRSLQDGFNLDKMPDNAVKKLLGILMDSDIIECVVGTKINDAHQDPNLPKDLEIRRNLMKQFTKVLERKYLKSTRLLFL